MNIVNYSWYLGGTCLCVSINCMLDRSKHILLAVNLLERFLYTTKYLPRFWRVSMFGECFACCLKLFTTCINFLLSLVLKLLSLCPLLLYLPRWYISHPNSCLEFLNFYSIFTLTGAIAILVANPTDLVKVRLQAEGKLPAGVPRRYSGALDAYLTIVKQVSLLAIILPFPFLVPKCINSSIFQKIGRIRGPVDWAWPKCSTKCYNKCCWTSQLWPSETGNIIVLGLLGWTCFVTPELLLC